MNSRKWVTAGLLLFVGLLLVGLALAAPGATDLPFYVLGSGGGHLETGIYSLDGTLGQAVVGLDRVSTLELCSGFWCETGGVDSLYVYLPLIER